MVHKSALVFQHAGQNYVLEFERTKGKRSEKGKNGFTSIKPNKYPRTTAILFEVDRLDAPRSTWRMRACGIASCSHKDKFTKEQGRLKALAKMVTMLPTKEFRAKVFEFYLNRPRPKTETKAPSSAPPLALPPAPEAEVIDAQYTVH